jgi:Xaa-Pro aminopeptidase
MPWRNNIMNREEMYRSRFEKIEKCLKEDGFDGLYINDEVNRIYFSGFTGTFGVLLFLNGNKYFFTDSRYTGQAKKEIQGFEILEYKKKTFYSKLNELLKTHRIKKLGFESDRLTYDQYSDIKEKLNKTKLLSIGDRIKNLRAIKDDDEAENIKKAVNLADKAFSHILKFIKPGVKESELSAEIEFFFRKNGSKGSSFRTIVASGERSSLPHGVASDKELEKGDTITFDFGAIYNNYCSDITRTVFLGEPNSELRRIYDIVLRAQTEAINAIKPGMKAFEADRIARDIINGEGYKNEFEHGLGHGVGIEVHEMPSLSPNSDIILKKGMVVTIEPGIYINELGGVRIEDMLMLRDEKATVFTTANKELIII